MIVDIMTVEILTGFSYFLIDEGAKRLNERFLEHRAPKGQWIPFSFKEFLADKCRMTRTLGNAQKEEIAEVVLVACAQMNSVAGVLEEELFRVFENSGGRFTNETHRIHQLVDLGFFRRTLILGAAYLFPTENLFLRLVQHKEEFHSKKEAAQ